MPVSSIIKAAKEVFGEGGGFGSMMEAAQQTASKDNTIHMIVQSQSKKRSEQASPKPSDSMKKDTAQTSAVRTSDQTVRHF